MTAFKPTLAVAADFSKLVYPVYASPKLDGIRCSIVGGKALSRSLKAIPNLHISSALSRPELEGLDGELIIGEPTSKTCYTDSVSGVMRVSGAPVFTYFVFDLHDVPSGFSGRRQAMLDALGKGAWKKYPQICLLEQNLINNEAELLTYEAECMTAGYEGVILRSPSAPYKYGRSTVNEGYMLKVKRFEDSEAEILGVEEEMHNANAAETNELGRTKRSSHQAGKVGKGTMGALKVRDCVSGIEFSIGTGFTAEQRAAPWDVGALVRYKFFPVGVKIAPRHPVYLGMRDRSDL